MAYRGGVRCSREVEQLTSAHSKREGPFDARNESRPRFGQGGSCPQSRVRLPSPSLSFVYPLLLYTGTPQVHISYTWSPVLAWTTSRNALLTGPASSPPNYLPHANLRLQASSLPSSPSSSPSSLSTPSSPPHSPAKCSPPWPYPGLSSRSCSPHQPSPLPSLSHNPNSRRSQRRRGRSGERTALSLPF